MIDGKGRPSGSIEHSREDALARARLERFPVMPVVLIGIALSLVGVVVGIATATTHRHPGLGAGLAIVCATQLLILVLAGAAVRTVEDWRISQLRSEHDQRFS